MQSQIADSQRKGLSLGRIGGNVFWSLLRYSSSWIALLIVPPLLAHRMSSALYGTWMLILQCASYITFFDSNMQTAIARYVGRADGTGDRGYLTRVLASVLVLLVVASCGAILIVAVATKEFGWLFPAIPTQLLPQAQKALLITGFSIAIALPSTTLVGGFLGLQQNRIVTFAILLSKVISSAGMSYAALHHGTIVELSVWFSTGVLIQPFFYFFCWIKQRDLLPLQPRQADLNFIGEFGKFYAILALNSLAFILISGLDLPLVARFDFVSAGYYSFATIFSNMLLIPQGAILGVALPAISNRITQLQPNEIGQVLHKLTRYASITLSALTFALMLGAPFLLYVWLGNETWRKVLPLALVLLAAQVLAMVAEPLQIMVLAVGKQVNLIPAWLASAITNLMCSIILGMKLGAMGVAMGTLIGAMVGVIAQFVITLRHTTEIALPRNLYAKAAILDPIAASLPALLLLCVMWFLHWDTMVSLLCAFMGVPITAAILWKRTIGREERHQLTSALMRKLRRG